ncbi:ArsR/SmtB family transcription factor [Streptococcus pluranimalium]|uniref:ArsR/SmtB family transcription factor n=1 Tax=Streptococcus pluranimalium TaxID=82348 RepID=UPI003F68E4AA
MQGNYSSELIEQLFVASLVSDKGEDMEMYKSSPMIETMAIYDQIHELLQPYKEKIKSLVLPSSDYFNLLHQCYFTLLNKGMVLENIEDFHDLCLKLSESEIQECLLALLEPENNQAGDFLDLLEETTLTEERKWHFLAFYRHPLEKMTELIALSRKLVKIYQPFLEIERDEKESFLASERLQVDLGESRNYYQLEGSVEPIVLSSWFMRGYFIQANSRTHLFVVSLGMLEQTQAKLELEEGHFYDILKSLSDPSRYQTMMSLTKPGAKRNTIAKELGISGAAVSFHTQKLLTAQLIQQNVEDKNTKYKTNTKLLVALVEKIQEDFDLK